MSYRMTLFSTVALAASVTFAGVGFAQQAQQPDDDLALTVYNNDFAVVKEIRTIDLEGERDTVQLRDVASKIIPDSVLFTSITAPGSTVVLEQNYEYDLVDSDKLLEKYIDRPLTVVTKDGGRYTGTLLSYDGQQVVLRGEESLHMIQRPDNITHISFTKLPEGLITRPTLVWDVATDKPGEHRAQITYQTNGMSWDAAYNAVISEDDSHLDITGWVTIDNRSGKTYNDAVLKLIAGDVRKVEPQRPRPQMERMAMADAARGPQAGFQQQSFFEYHLYTLGRRATVKDNQMKQIELLTAEDVPVTKRFVFEPGGRYWHPVQRYGDENLYKVNIFVEFKNEEEANLGMPLPKGVVRVYKAEPDEGGPAGFGDMQFVGEDRIDHTPKGEELRVYVGDAFDIVGEKTITDQKQGKRWRQQTVRIELRNHKDEAVTVRIREHLGYGQWKIENPSDPFEKVDSDTIRFDVEVPAEGSKEVTYTASYTW